MKRPHLASLLLAGLAGSGAAAEPAARPNVLLICVDDLKPALGCYGEVHARTPNIDRLAARGTVFTRAYVQQAVCAPSRNSLFTGLRPDQIGVYDLGTFFRRGVADAVTLPQSFKAAGWHSLCIGKGYHLYHGNSDDPASWSEPSWMPRGKAPALDPFEGPEPPPGSVFQQPAPGKGPLPPAWGWPDIPDAETGDGKIAIQAVQRLGELSAAGTPFFMCVGFLKPHLPFVAPKRWWDAFDPATLPLAPVDARLPEGAPTLAGHDSGELRTGYARIQRTGDLTAAQARTLVHGYYASTAFVDAQVGRVLDALAALPLSERTIVVLWGDHGWHLGDHGLWCKHTNYEQSARNPLIIAAPGMRPGVAAGLAATIDVYPTVCALAGLAPPAGLPGTSLVPILADPAARVQDAVFHVYPRRGYLGRAVRTERWRHVAWCPTEPGDKPVLEELYDLEGDPGETVNLAGRPAQAEVLAGLRARLAALAPAKPQVASATVKGDAAK